MAENSKIEWTDHTFNGWIGCTKVGPGCDHCYAEALATSRLQVPWGPGAPRRRTAASTWNQPRRWDRKAAAEGGRYRVFCSSLADVFDNEVDPAWRADLFQLIRETPNLDWLLVTKRIGNASKMIAAAGGLPDNVWLGATVVSQAEAERDIPKLAEVKRRYEPRFAFLSIEPLLSSIDLIGNGLLYQPCPNSLDGISMDWETGAYECCSKCDFTGISDELAIDWVIVGGESGPHARPMHPDWVRSLRDQCASAEVPFLFKQWGEWAPANAGDRCISLEGANMPNLEPDGRNGDGTTRISRVGKKAAGRLLDGVQHDGVPA